MLEILLPLKLNTKCRWTEKSRHLFQYLGHGLGGGIKTQGEDFTDHWKGEETVLPDGALLRWQLLLLQLLLW